MRPPTKVKKNSTLFTHWIFGELCFRKFKRIFFNRNDVPTTVTQGAVAMVDYLTAVSPLALPDAQKPNLHPPEGTTME
ncbi:hypothetical protein Hanom_Chr00s002713g01703681 [Helianthus anomalus]